MCTDISKYVFKTGGDEREGVRKFKVVLHITFFVTLLQKDTFFDFDISGI
jgi:hypothetical protein